MGESLLEAETVEDLDTPVNCFRKLFGTNLSSLHCFIFVFFSLSNFVVHLLVSLSVCDVLPLILNNPEMCLPVSLLYKYMHKAAEFYICYVTREPSADGQMQGKSMLLQLIYEFAYCKNSILYSGALFFFFYLYFQSSFIEVNRKITALMLRSSSIMELSSTEVSLFQ